MKEIRVAVPWGVRDVLKALAVLVVIILPGFLLSLLPFSSGHLASSRNPLLVTLILTLMAGTLIFLAWNFGVRRYRVSFKELGFYNFNVAWGLIQGVLWLIAVKIFAVVYGALAMYFFRLKPPEELIRGIPDIFGSGIGGLLLAILVVSFVAPIAEETFFRGFVYPALRKKFGIWAGILISAVVFALFHARIWLIIPVMAMGVVLAFLYEKKKSLGPSIVLHSLNNLLSIIIIYAQKG